MITGQILREIGVKCNFQKPTSLYHTKRQFITISLICQPFHILHFGIFFAPFFINLAFLFFFLERTPRVYILRTQKAAI